MDEYPKIKRDSDILWVSCLTIVFWCVAVKSVLSRSLWSDELAGILTAQRPLKDGLLQLQDFSAPLYQMILRVLINSEYPPEWLIRLPALVFSVLGLVSIGFFAKRLFGTRVAAIAILLVAVNPMFMKYAGEGRPYSMFLLFSVLSMLTFYNFINKYKFVQIFLYIVSTSLLIYSHYFGFLVLGAQIIYALSKAMIVKEERQQVMMLVASFFIIFFISIPALCLISRHLLNGVKGIVGWIGRPQVIDLIWIRQSGELIGDSSLSILCIISIIVAIINDRSPILTGKQEIFIEKTKLEKWWIAREPVLLCLYWIIFGLYLPVVVSYFWRPIFIQRYGFPVLVPLLVIISYIISLFRFKYMMMITIVMITLPVYNTLNYLEMPKLDYPAVIYMLNKLNDDQSPVYLTHLPYCEGYKNPELYGLRYYGYKGKEINLITMSYPDFISIANPEIIQKKKRIFIVVFNKWPAIEGYFKSDLRAYRIFHFGYMHLFEVEKEGIQGRWTK